MIISFNTGKISTNNSGGLLQQKRIEVTGNGLDVVVPDAGYDGLSTVYIKTDVGDGGGSFKDFSVIGYDDETSIMLNNEIDDDIAYSKSLYDAWNPENTSARNLYKSDTKLVYAPAIDTSNVTSFYGALSGCTNLEYIPDFVITNNVTTYEYFCANCTKLKRVPKISMKRLPTDCFTDVLYKGYKMLYECGSIVTMGGFVDCEHIRWASGTYHPFYGKSKLENVLEMGIFKYSLNISNSSKLTVESLMVFINALYNFTEAGETPTLDQGKLTIGSTNLAKLTEEQIAIATGKGWVLS